MQAKIIPVSKNEIDYAYQVKQTFEQSGIRVDVDIREEKLGYKIREAQIEKVPFMFIIGENERNSGTISVRKRGESNLGVQSVEGIVEMLREGIQARR